MSGALDRGGVERKRPALKPPVRYSYSHNDFLDMLNMLYLRFFDRASAIETKQKAGLFIDASGETLETIKQSKCYSELAIIVKGHDLTNPAFRGKELAIAAKEILAPGYKQGALL